MKKISGNIYSLVVGCCLLFHVAPAQVLFEIDGNPVSTEEFKYVYQKNSFNNPEAYTKQDLENYLKLFINFKLKVQAAKDAGLDTIPSLINEYKSYASQIAKPYLTDTSAIDQLVKTAYARLNTEINASHILLRLNSDASPSDTTASWNKILEIRERALNGEDFTALARQYSQDPSAKNNGGDLGYFTSMQMVYPFENAAYQTDVNNISQPVRTRFGYHIIKVHDKRPSEGKVQVAHIMLRFRPGVTGEEKG